MLPGFIIDQIRQREEEEQAKREILQIELPVPEGSKAPDCDEESERRVIIIDLLGD